jgi:hypothetical protein
VAIIMVMFAGKGGCLGGQSYLGLLAKTKKEKEPLVQQWGGKDPKGRPFWESLDLQRWPERGDMKGLEVTRVDPTGPAASYFGLQTGDIITEIGMHEVGGPIIESVAAGADFLTDAFAKNFPIKIRRAGQELVLPGPGAGGTGANAPAGLPNLPGTRSGGL